MHRLISTRWILGAILVLLVATATAQAARDKHSTGQLFVKDDGSATVELLTKIPGMGDCIVYAEFEPVSAEDVLEFLDSRDAELAEPPGTDTEFGLGVAVVLSEKGEIRTADVLVRFDPGRPLQIDFPWTESVTLRDGLTIDDTRPFPRSFPPALSIGVAPDGSGVVLGSTLWAKKIIMIC
jgi:hypothetical protein